MELPLWFLVLSLALPRMCIVVSYFSGQLPGFILSGWVSPVLCLFIPRLVVMILIFQDRGMSVWLLVHAAVMAGVYSGGGSRTINKYQRTNP